jgi:hypothetical protein
MTPRLESMASYIAALLRIRDEHGLSRTRTPRRLEAALAAFTQNCSPLSGSDKRPDVVTSFQRAADFCSVNEPLTAPASRA